MTKIVGAAISQLIRDRWQLIARENSFPQTWTPVFSPRKGWRVVNRDARPGQNATPLGPYYYNSQTFAEMLRFVMQVSTANRKLLDGRSC